MSIIGVKTEKLKLILANQPECHFAFSGEWALKQTILETHWCRRFTRPFHQNINSRNKNIEFVFEAMSSCSMTSAEIRAFFPRLVYKSGENKAVEKGVLLYNYSGVI